MLYDDDDELLNAQKHYTALVMYKLHEQNAQVAVENGTWNNMLTITNVLGISSVLAACVD